MKGILFKNGEPCSVSCMSHVTHPCEQCGRTQAEGEYQREYKRLHRTHMKFCANPKCDLHSFNNNHRGEMYVPVPPCERKLVKNHLYVRRGGEEVYYCEVCVSAIRGARA